MHIVSRLFNSLTSVLAIGFCAVLAVYAPWQLWKSHLAAGYFANTTCEQHKQAYQRKDMAALDTFDVHWLQTEKVMMKFIDKDLYKVAELKAPSRIALNCESDPTLTLREAFIRVPENSTLTSATTN